ncbi:MAG: hypothetical protein WBI88_11850, partial [Caldicoprobacterales bacterium]
ELIGGKRIIPQDLDMLPLSLPYKVDAVYEKTSVVPKELRENITVQVYARIHRELKILLLNLFPLIVSCIYEQSRNFVFK